MGVMVCIPASREQARELLANGSNEPVAAFAATEHLYQTFDLAPSQDEDAEFATALIASIAALTRFGERLVLVADVDAYEPDPATEHDGGVIISRLEPQQISAWFVDASPAVAEQASRVAEGLSVDEAWELPDVVDLLANHDLCWHDSSERMAI